MTKWRSVYGWAVIWLLFLCVIAAPSAAAERTTVIFADIDGIVGVPMEEHIANVFGEIGQDKNAVLIFRMNTPGGLVASMSEIMTMIAEADFPVVVWVAPGGARAASAGAFIVQAAHVAVMAPGTNIGAAHPVTAGGGDIKESEAEIDRKIINDLTAKMRSFAEERGRNVKAAESMVKESASFTAREAVKGEIVDFIASDEDDLLRQLDGRKVTVKGQTRTISLQDSVTRRIEITPRLRLLGFLSNPNVAYLALIAGVFLIVLELRSPGGFVMGVTGALLLITASYGLRVLPVNMAGVALLIAGIAIIVLDFLMGGMGFIAILGIAAMLFGGLILFKAPGAELLHLSAGFIVGVTLVIALAFLLVMRVVYKALRRRPVSGEGALIGARLRVSGFSGGEPMSMVHGEYWRVRPADAGTTLQEGDEAEVVKVESLVLYVRLLPQRDEKGTKI